MYAQFLANQHTAINSIKNYVAGAKSWVLNHQGDISSFMSNQLAVMYKSIAKHSSHSTKRASPLSWEDIECICLFLDSCSLVPLAVKPCILIGYSAFLRSSNLLSVSNVPWGGPHTLLTRNVLETDKGLVIVICSTKSKTKPYTVNIPRLANQELCPTVAWNRYVRAISPPSTGPAFVLANKMPLAPKTVVAFMQAALARDPSRDVSYITMHSLRRGAVQDADRAGISHKVIMSRGGWSSTSGFKPYLSK